MLITKFEQLVAELQSQKAKTRIVAAAANDSHTIEAVVQARRAGLLEAAFVGDLQIITTILSGLGEDASDYMIVAAGSSEDCMDAALGLVHSGEADVLMKGKLETADFMRGVLSKNNGLRTGAMLSVIGLFELPGYHKLLAVSDQAVNTYPDLNAKKDILLNAVHLLHAIGIVQPKVAVLAAIEKVNPKMPETVDAEALKAMWQEGEISGCIVDGPLSFDIATSAEAAEIKGYSSQVAGDADLLLVPDIVCGNVISKALTGFAGAITAGCVMGAKVPLVLTPRSAGADDKFYSIALAAYVARNS
jgi:phosphotransacetylase